MKSHETAITESAHNIFDSACSP